MIPFVIPLSLLLDELGAMASRSSELTSIKLGPWEGEGRRKETVEVVILHVVR